LNVLEMMKSLNNLGFKFRTSLLKLMLEFFHLLISGSKMYTMGNVSF